MKRSYYAAFMAAAVLACVPFDIDGCHSAASAGTIHRNHAPQYFAPARREHRTSPCNRLHQSVVHTVAHSSGHRPSNRYGSRSTLSYHRSHDSVSRRLAAIVEAKTPAQTTSSQANFRIAQKAMQVAKQMNTVGWCYKGVCNALSFFGVHLSGAAAYQAKDQLLSDKRFRPLTVSKVNQLKPGDIMVHGASQSHPYGHIAVYLGNDSEASDHVQPVVFNGPYNGMTVFRYEGT